MKRTVFVSGVSRSGTSALVNTLNQHPALMVGMERFYHLIQKRSLTGDHFERNRFLNVRPEDTHGAGGLSVPDPGARFEQATFIGDKFPNLFKHFDYIFGTFPDALHVYIVRNPLSVIESAHARTSNPADTWNRRSEDMIRDWNQSVWKVAHLPAEQRRNFILLSYETHFASAAQINRLYERLGLAPLDPASLAAFVDKFHALNEKMVPRRDDLRQLVAMRAAWASYRKICEWA